MKIGTVLAIGVLALIAIAVILVTGDDKSATSQVGQARGRWHNVVYARTLTLNGEDYDVMPRVDPGQTQQVTLNVVLIDGLTGLTADSASATVITRAATDDPIALALLDLLEQSLRVEPFDESKAPFPYVDDPLAGAEPDPLSGIIVSGFAAITRGQGVMFYNYRSRLIIWTDSPEGTLEYSCQALHPLDRGAFTRLLQAQLTPPGTRPVPVNYPEGVDSCVLP